MLKAIKEFINFWWFRYLLVTELYIVETWERVTIRILFNKQILTAAFDERRHSNSQNIAPTRINDNFVNNKIDSPNLVDIDRSLFLVNIT